MKYLSSLCASSLEGRARCSRNTEPSQAFRKAVWASAGERESSIPPTIILCWRHQTLLHFPVSVALGFSAVFYVTASLPPEARTLLAAQMVQRRCPLSWAWNTHTQVVIAEHSVYLWARWVLITVRYFQLPLKHLTFSICACVLQWKSVIFLEWLWICVCVRQTHTLFWMRRPPMAVLRPSAVELPGTACCHTEPLQLLHKTS